MRKKHLTAFVFLLMLFFTMRGEIIEPEIHRGTDPKRIEINGPIRAVYEDGYLRFFFDTDLGFVTCSVRNANYDENWVTTMNSYLKEGDMYIGQQSGEFFITIVTEAGTVFTSTCTLIQNNSTEE